MRPTGSAQPLCSPPATTEDQWHTECGSKDEPAQDARCHYGTKGPSPNLCRTQGIRSMHVQLNNMSIFYNVGYIFA